MPAVNVVDEIDKIDKVDNVDNVDNVDRIGAALVVLGVGLWLGGVLACVDTGHRAVATDASTAPDAVQPATCASTPPVGYSGGAGIPSTETAAPGPYAWKNVVIEGGGFVSGIVVSPALSGLAFARTDVGGAYRFDPTNDRWWPITDWVGHSTSNEIGIESIAADPVDPNRVYLAAGEYLTAGNGVILSSTDMGRTFTPNDIGAPMGGNADGRSMGERLAIDPNLTSTLYFGSRNAGLWTSTDSAQTWTQVTGFCQPTAGDGGACAPITGETNGGVGSSSSSGTGYGLTFVVFDPSSGPSGSATPAIYVGVGVTTGTALYHSTDAGATWQAVPGQPAGMMPHHAVLDGCGNIYFAYNNGSGPNGITAGAVWRYTMPSGAWTDVSPPTPSGTTGGFGGIAADPAHPGTLVVTTMDRWSAPEIYRTTNGGSSWRGIGLGAAYDVAGAQWLWWHGNSLPSAGWMGNVEIDPFNPSRALFITGQGLWSSDDVTAADSGAVTHWTFDDDGLEETVALDLASPPVGAPLLSGVGDIGGFRHDDLDVSPPGGMFDNPIFGNTTSLDFAEGAPSIVARVGTSSSAGQANGACSTDGGTTWTPFATAPTATGNSAPSSGSIAVAADGSSFVWVPKGGTPSYARNNVAASTFGAAWTACTGLPAGALVAADRVNAAKFYAGSGGKMYASTDGGATFVPATFAQGTAAASGRPRPVFGIEGEVWVPTKAGLLHSQDSGATFASVPAVNGATAVGFGMAAPGQSYPAVYLAGAVSVGGGATYVWGTYRSDDVAAWLSGAAVAPTWQRIDDAQHQFGYINVLTGDERQYGRVYLGTSGRGIVYGDPQ